MTLSLERGGWYIFAGFGSPGRVESVLGQTVIVSFPGRTNSREEPIWLIKSRIENPEEIARLEAEAGGGEK
ncbi:MAG: hypothetical protein ACOYS2_02420 [Patescibacteria group bacterium]